MTTAVAVNLVKYVHNTPRDVSQYMAFSSLQQEFQVYPFCFPGEVEFFKKNYGVKPWLLSQDSRSLVGGHRQLPFIKEMIETVLESSGIQWIGFINSDILVTPKLSKMIESLGPYSPVPTIQAVIAHRTDVDSFVHTPVDRDILHNGVDTFFMRRLTWRLMISDYPNWVLGEPGWGQGTVKWCQLHGIPFKSLKGHETLHERHDAYWKKRATPATAHNQDLYRQVCRELGKKG